ncbi:hypothetical protein SERLADRAFT_466773 [Serpula lacrymans var. lacrymans S7.9]|uniref:Uncharacterized protein n=1 Tax=Serpula lacrymans var. lacrymans (strain S7.9) TaxID=578457 RepID=F8NUR9_SERL9|nr:uncharacterized protein SERLADRAFT_466773 [Serpula lacrymans var. lacrymans S7.9]EGO25927.1 hypothetical protein SERLADRAFT_466773 [Serpula lacrymans var. lacrymans S7.9]
MMDVDAAARFADHRPPYRRLTPPPVADARTRGYYPPPSPSRAEPASAYDVDADRRFPPGDRRDWQFDRRREWSLAEEDKSRSAWRSWDRTMDRDRYERDVPPVRGSGWEAREERDRRPYYPGSPPSTRSVDGSRPLSSRLTEGGYPGPGEERGYPPRDLERSRYPPLPLATSPPPFSRVRGRSPSPVRRGEELAATPPPSSGGSFYDSRVGPPTQFSAVGQPGGGPPLDRDYAGARDRTSDLVAYGSSSYDRDVRPARSPPPSRMPPPPPPYARNSYNPRDDRRYMPPPPRTS